MKKTTKRPKYFLYAYAYDLDEQLPPFMGKVSYVEFDDLEEAKQEIMRTELSRFAGFEIVVLEVKDQNSKIDDPKDCYHSITINQATSQEHQQRLQQYFQSLAAQQSKNENQPQQSNPTKKRNRGCK